MACLFSIYIILKWADRLLISNLWAVLRPPTRDKQESASHVFFVPTLHPPTPGRNRHIEIT